MFCDERDLLKRRESANCDLRVITDSVADSLDNITKMGTGSRRRTVRPYSFIRHSVDGGLVKARKRLKEVLDREASSL